MPQIIPLLTLTLVVRGMKSPPLEHKLPVMQSWHRFATLRCFVWFSPFCLFHIFVLKGSYHFTILDAIWHHEAKKYILVFTTETRMVSTV